MNLLRVAGEADLDIGFAPVWILAVGVDVNSGCQLVAVRVVVLTNKGESGGLVKAHMERRARHPPPRTVV